VVRGHCPSLTTSEHMATIGSGHTDVTGITPSKELWFWGKYLFRRAKSHCNESLIFTALDPPRRVASVVRSPNGQPQFMITRQTFINANMSVSFSRRASTIDAHFFSAPTLWHFGATNY
jgi:hypothetical protein